MHQIVGYNFFSQFMKQSILLMRCKNH